MKKSFTATVLPQHLRQTIHHRGSGDVGAIVDMSEGDHYVPRANWTEAIESPMRCSNRNADFDPKQFVKEQEARNAQTERKRTYLQGQFDRSFQETAWKTANMNADKAHTTMVREANLAQHGAAENERKAKIEENKKLMCEHLKARQRELAKHSRHALLTEARERAEIDMRTAQTLNDEHMEQDKRRKAAEENGKQILLEVARRGQQKSDDRVREAEEQRKTMKSFLLQEEYRLMAQQQLYKACGEQMDVMTKIFSDTAGKQNAERERKELERLDRDMLRNNLKIDKHYASREQARENSRLHMIKGLNAQQTAGDKRRLIENQMKQMDNEAGGGMLEDGIRMEAEKQAHRLAEAKKVQQDQIAHMGTNQRREMKEAAQLGNTGGHRRPTQVGTMAKMAATARKQGIQGSKSDSSLKRAPATPPRVEIKPHVDISRGPGFGGSIGCFGGEGGTQAILLRATGGQCRLLTGLA